MGVGEVTDAIAAIRAGQAVLLPADGVYGLCASAYREGPVRRLYEIKGRDDGPAVRDDRRQRRHADRMRARASRPLGGDRSHAACRGRSPSCCRIRPTATAGSRARAPTRSASGSPTCRPTRSGCSMRSGRWLRRARTNRASRRPASLAEVPARIRARCGAEIDAGALGGLPSTVIDFSGPEPVVLRVGGGDPEEATALVAEALAGSGVA